MTIREAYKTDIPEIVQILKLSLGVTDFPVSEEVWNFKHLINPFGESLVLLALEDEKIIGVRAFMKWQWQTKQKTFTAYRAVDTATHPEHRGKGIFKKLTLKAVDIAKEDGDNFIFNTPNEASRPGYLKMGWEPAGKIRVGLRPSMNSFWKADNKSKKYQVERKVSSEGIKELCKAWNEKVAGKGKIFTPKNPNYLSWRYEKNPLQEYEVFIDHDLYMAGYIKLRKGLRELRLSECIFHPNAQTNKKIKKIINLWSSRFGVHVISFSPELLDLGFLVIKGNFGPILTVKELNLDDDANVKVFDVENWAYSLGDLELF